MEHEESDQLPEDAPSGQVQTTTTAPTRATTPRSRRACRAPRARTPATPAAAGEDASRRGPEGAEPAYLVWRS